MIIKTGFLLLMATVVSLLLAFLWVRSFMIGIAEESLRVEAQIITKTFKSNLVYMPNIEQLELMQTAADYISSDHSDIVGVVVVDKGFNTRAISRFTPREFIPRVYKNQVVDDAMKVDEGDMVIKLNVGKVTGNPELTYLDPDYMGSYLSSLENVTLDIGFPIFKESRRLGVVEIQMSLARWGQYLQKVQIALLVPLGIWGLSLITLGLVFISFAVLRPVSQIIEATRQIAAGDLKRRIDWQSRDEIGVLSSSINTMTENLQQNQEALKKTNEGLVRLSRELEIKNAQLRQKQAELDFQIRLAQSIQKHILPQRYPEIPGLKFAVRSVPAEGVGGDLFDFITLDDGKIAVLIGDVSGKGFPAALIQSMSSPIFSHIIRSSGNVSEILNQANEIMFERFGEEHSTYLTVFLVIINPVTGRMRYGRAGHVPSFILKAATGEVVNLHAKGFGVGMFEKGSFEENAASLSTGDRIVLYTDGVIDARNQNDETFGYDRLTGIVRENSALNGEELVEKISSQVEAFRKPEGRDDFTLMVIDYSPPPKPELSLEQGDSIPAPPEDGEVSC